MRSVQSVRWVVASAVAEALIGLLALRLACLSAMGVLGFVGLIVAAFVVMSWYCGLGLEYRFEVTALGSPQLTSTSAYCVFGRADSGQRREALPMGKHRAPSRRLKLLALGSLIDLSGMETYERARSQVPQRAPK